MRYCINEIVCDKNLDYLRIIDYNQKTETYRAFAYKNKRLDIVKIKEKDIRYRKGTASHTGECLLDLIFSYIVF